MIVFIVLGVSAGVVGWLLAVIRDGNRRAPHDCGFGYGCCKAITPKGCPWGRHDDFVGMKEGGW